MEHKARATPPITEVEMGIVDEEATTVTVVIEAVVEVGTHQWEETSEW